MIAIFHLQVLKINQVLCRKRKHFGKTQLNNKKNH